MSFLSSFLLSFLDSRLSRLSRSLLESEQSEIRRCEYEADDRIILETDAAAIASRVSRPRADTTDIVINEQTVRDACKSFSTHCYSLWLRREMWLTEM